MAIAAQVQALLDSRHQAAPSRTLLGEPPRPAKVPLNVKRQSTGWTWSARWLRPR